ncbi:cytochrome P450 [Rhodopirellula europaea]|jgi:cytochrome P450|uniref:Cytochrome P450 n=1 Tax=Rhodopirellula europaea SH398 TaxID=1263868 RepID=M5SDW2_9BACT|nr:cytochrome P450 [Rhodopirellula europaea]EMI24324.1 Cytochrome P450 [Rhodopirellula europaea SH398]MCR9210097.1 cytochrome P450 [bacterium]
MSKKNDMKSDWNPDSDDVKRDQVAAYDEMRERCPVAHSEVRGWSVFRHADVVQVLNDHERFSNQVSRHLSVPNGMDPPEHTVYRQIIEPYFASEPMAAFEPICRDIASDLLSEVAALGSDVEVMGDLAQHFAVRVQCAFLGWPTSLHEPLIRWANSHQRATRDADRVALSALARELDAIVDDLIEQRVQSGAKASDDVTASLMHQTVHDRRLSNEEIGSILRNWTVGELGTISASIGIFLQHLADNSAHQDVVRRDRSRLPAAIDEILRVHNPLHGNRRTTTCPVKLGGRSIGAGERVYINWIAANRDPFVFEDAASVKFDRNPNDNLLYGAGIHVCPGAPLARLEMRVFMEALMDRTTTFHLQPTSPALPASFPASGYATVRIFFHWK